MCEDKRDYPIEACRAKICRHGIIWGRTLAGRTMPVDAAPTDAGTILLQRRQGVVYAEVLKGSVLDAARSHEIPLRTSHFATCPAAAEFRKDH